MLGNPSPSPLTSSVTTTSLLTPHSAGARLHSLHSRVNTSSGGSSDSSAPSPQEQSSTMPPSSSSSNIPASVIMPPLGNGVSSPASSGGGGGMLTPSSMTPADMAAWAAAAAASSALPHQGNPAHPMTGAGAQPPVGFYHPGYDHSSLAAYGYGSGYDLAARRKNATRESTSTLKAWLNEHKKNPYPTKGEKIMLAIITKMTLTQVSTWFANARRRLKKENKMTWEPKNKLDDEDVDVSDDDDDMLMDQDDRCSKQDEDSLIHPSTNRNLFRDMHELRSHMQNKSNPNQTMNSRHTPPSQYQNHHVQTNTTTTSSPFQSLMNHQQHNNQTYQTSTIPSSTNQVLKKSPSSDNQDIHSSPTMNHSSTFNPHSTAVSNFFSTLTSSLQNAAANHDRIRSTAENVLPERRESSTPTSPFQLHQPSPQQTTFPLNSTGSGGKPKIWSLADTAGGNNKDTCQPMKSEEERSQSLDEKFSSSSSAVTTNQQLQSLYAAAIAAASANTNNAFTNNSGAHQNSPLSYHRSIHQQSITEVALAHSQWAAATRAAAAMFPFLQSHAAAAQVAAAQAANNPTLSSTSSQLQQSPPPPFSSTPTNPMDIFLRRASSSSTTSLTPPSSSTTINDQLLQHFHQTSASDLNVFDKSSMENKHRRIGSPNHQQQPCHLLSAAVNNNNNDINDSFDTGVCDEKKSSGLNDSFSANSPPSLALSRPSVKRRSSSSSSTSTPFNNYEESITASQSGSQIVI